MNVGFDFTTLLEETLQENKKHTERGQLPSYIPELKKGNPKHAGIALQTTTGLYEAGDTQVRFTLQSISKVISLWSPWSNVALRQCLLRLDQSRLETPLTV